MDDMTMKELCDQTVWCEQLNVEIAVRTMFNVRMDWICRD